MRTVMVYKWPLLICAAAAAITAWLVWSLLPGPGISLVIPDETSFEVTRPGRYTLWLQSTANPNGKLTTFPAGLPPGVTIAISKSDGATVPIHSTWPTTHRDTADAIQLAIGDVRFDSPGSYRIAVDGLPEKRALHLDQSDMRGFFFKVTFMIVGLPALILGSLAWALLIFFTRRRNTAAAMPPIRRGT